MYIIKIKDIENNLVAECRVDVRPNDDDVKSYGDYWHQIDEVPLKETRDSRPRRMLRINTNGNH